jgi:glycerophosphoryl diester phosphodiesterase
MTLAELQRFDAGKGEQIPTLEDALRTATGRIGLMLEVKAQGIGEQVFTTVGRSRFTGTTIYASFVTDDILGIKHIEPQAKTMQLLARRLPNQPVPFVKAARASHVGLRHNTVTRPLVDAFHRAAIQVFVYTVNDPSDIRTIRSFGVDGIISDFPDRL